MFRLLTRNKSRPLREAQRAAFIQIRETASSGGHVLLQQNMTDSVYRGSGKES